MRTLHRHPTVGFVGTEMQDGSCVIRLVYTTQLILQRCAKIGKQRRLGPSSPALPSTIAKEGDGTARPREISHSIIHRGPVERRGAFPQKTRSYNTRGASANLKDKVGIHQIESGHPHVKRSSARRIKATRGEGKVAPHGACG